MKNVQSSARRGPRPVPLLVVDDVEDARETLRMLLEGPGLNVLAASSAAEAFELLLRHEVALALLDVEMPGVSGLELAERMHADPRTRDVPIMFLTGHGFDSRGVFSGYEAGAVDIIYKPVEPRVLLSKVGVFVELYRQRRELRERNAELERLLRRNEAMAAELREAHGKAVQEALTDALTGVPNRRHILQMAEQALARQGDTCRPTSLAIMDLDHFKSINDRHGHPCGDAVLRDFCGHCRRHLRPGEALGRLGGEEFLLLMPDTTLATALDRTEELRQTLQPHRGVAYTFSAGLAQADMDESLHDLMRRADEALYRAKGLGRNRSEADPD
jgi:two-component system, cell cycle response regulator